MSEKRKGFVFAFHNGEDEDYKLGAELTDIAIAERKPHVPQSVVRQSREEGRPYIRLERKIVRRVESLKYDQEYREEDYYNDLVNVANDLEEGENFFLDITFQHASMHNEDTHSPFTIASVWCTRTQKTLRLMNSERFREDEIRIIETLLTDIFVEAGFTVDSCLDASGSVE